MVGELVVRFVLGGLIVSVFSVVGELFQPKSFSGIFGAAPSVALVSLVLAFTKYEDAYVSLEGRSMIAGAGALLVYSLASVAVVRRPHWPVAIGLGCLWGAWGAIAFVVWAIWLRFA